MIFGSSFTDIDYRDLERRSISRFWADAAQLRHLDHFDGKEMFHRKSNNADFSGILIPYHYPGSEAPVTHRLRRRNPEIDAGNGKPKNKYLSAPGDRNHFYIPPHITRQMLQDASIPIIFVEGEFKALALRGLAGEVNAVPRFIPIGLSGIWNWRGTIEITGNEHGQRVPRKGVIPDFHSINLVSRKVIIAFDKRQGGQVKPQVRAARHQFNIELRSRGAEVGFLEWNAEDGKGPDDLLVNRGDDFVLAQIARVEFNTATGWTAKLLCTDTGKPKALLFNAIMALSEDPAFAGVLRFDEFALKTIVDKEPPWERQNRRDKFWTEDDDRQACAWLQAKGIEVKVSVANEAVQTVAMQHSYHPVRDYLDGLPAWDGVKRVDNWLTGYCGVKASKYSSKVGRYFLISAVARVMEPGCKVDYCLILEGNQGIGKSQVVGILGGPWATDDVPDIQDRDIKEHIVGLWIIELPELSSLGKSDVNRIKAFLSSRTTRFRFAYGRRTADVPRQCVFIGTVNHSQYLRDETGNRRFWPVKTGKIDIERLKQDRDQLWAEALVLYREGNKWWSDDPNFIREAERQQDARFVRDPWDDSIREYLASKNDTAVPEILTKCIRKDKGLWSPLDERCVARCLVSQGWEKHRPRNGKERQWRYKRKN